MARIDPYFDKLLKSGGSDLHLHESQRPKIRLHGSLQEIEGAAELGQQEIMQMMREICSPGKWDRFEKNGDLDFAYALGDKARFRANYKKHYHGYGAVFRTIPTHIMTLEEL